MAFALQAGHFHPVRRGRAHANLTAARWSGPMNWAVLAATLAGLFLFGLAAVAALIAFFGALARGDRPE